MICLPLNAESTWYVGVDEDEFIGSVENTLVCSSPGVGYALTAIVMMLMQRLIS
ncbi:MAG: hypothetical protein K9I95_00010 [Flavobacteriaceae bacterium]|nr:hypothetical protein [Flavobacteriaceae bacterium]